MLTESKDMLSSDSHADPALYGLSDEELNDLPDYDSEQQSKPEPVPQPQPAGGINYAALLAAVRIRPTDTIEQSPVCLTVEENGQQFTIGTLGDFSTITGKAKAKKTFAVSCAVAAAVGSTLIIDRINGHLPEGKKTVLLFDTEQSRYHVLRVVKRICRLCGITDPPNLFVYSLREYAPDQRLKLIDFALNDTPGVGLAVIDGIRDLAVDPILDSEQASVIMTHLLQWTTRLQIHITCVLHQNKGESTTLRGHLGTEVVNKAQSVISVTRDSHNKEISRVEMEYARDQDFTPFSFSIDPDGLPYFVAESDERNTPGKGKDNPRPLTAEDITSILNRAFINDAYLGYGQLRTNVLAGSLHIGRPLSKGNAEIIISNATANGTLGKEKPNGKGHEKYYLTSAIDCPV